MHNFAYARAATAEDAIKAAAGGAVILAGGTELLNWMRLGITHTEKVVDIGRLEALRTIARDGDALRIGSRATLNDIGTNALVQRAAPVLAQACLSAASAQLRNLATIGGNILQKTRCPYFRAEAPSVSAMPWPCNKRVGGSGCAAKDSGYARLALFGWTEECVSTQPSDPAVALAVLDAEVEVVGPGGARTIAMADFHVTQDEAAQRASSRSIHPAAVENELKPDELIVAFRVPVGIATERSAYVKVRERASYEYAMVSAAAAVHIESQRIRSARVALGSVAQKPWRLRDAEAALTGQPLDAAVIDRALDAALVGARPRPGNAFKVKLARNAARRALMTAGGMA